MTFLELYLILGGGVALIVYDRCMATTDVDFLMPNPRLGSSIKSNLVELNSKNWIISGTFDKMTHRYRYAQNRDAENQARVFERNAESHGHF